MSEFLSDRTSPEKIRHDIERALENFKQNQKPLFFAQQLVELRKDLEIAAALAEIGPMIGLGLSLNSDSDISIYRFGRAGLSDLGRVAFARRYTLEWKPDFLHLGHQASAVFGMCQELKLEPRFDVLEGWCEWEIVVSRAKLLENFQKQK